MTPHVVAAHGRRRARAAQARGASLLLLVVLLIAGLAVVPAYADSPPGHSHHESPAGTVAVLLLAAMAGIVAAVARRWGRRAVIPVLALLVGWLGLESAVHSVHHFWDPQSAASCPLFLASQHVEGAGASPTIAGTTTWTTQPSPTFDDQRIRPLQAFSSHEGRAPPVLPSA